MAVGKFFEIEGIAQDAAGRAEFGPDEAGLDEATQVAYARDIRNLCKEIEEILPSLEAEPQDFHDEASEPFGILRTSEPFETHGRNGLLKQHVGGLKGILRCSHSWTCIAWWHDPVMVFVALVLGIGRVHDKLRLGQ